MQKRLDLRILGTTPAIAIQSADDELIIMGEKAGVTGKAGHRRPSLKATRKRQPK